MYVSDNKSLILQETSNNGPSTLWKYPWKQFYNELSIIVSNNNIDDKIKMNKLYDLIHKRYQYLKDNKLRPNQISIVTLPDEIHLWFKKNLKQNQLYDHFQNLIDCNVNLCTSNLSKQIIIKLLQSSEIDISLITLENMLFPLITNPHTTIDNASLQQTIFIEKLINLYDWNTLILITNNIIKRGKWDYIPYYLTALVHKLNKLKQTSINIQKGKSNKMININTQRLIVSQHSFIRFLIELLFVLSHLQDWKLVFPLFKKIIETINTLQRINNNNNNNHVSISFLNKPILQIIKMLRINGNNDEIFQFISFLTNDIKIMNHLIKNFQFQKRLLNELLSSFRSLQDPLLSCQFLMATVTSPNMESLLNDLGILSYIYYHQVGKLSSQQILDCNKKFFNPFHSSKLKFKFDNNLPILTELYQVILSNITNNINSNIVTSLNFNQNKITLLKLYDSYLTKLNQSKKDYYFWKIDTGILIQFLKIIITKLNDPQLAYKIVLEFFQQSFAKKIRVVSSQSKIIPNIDSPNSIPISFINNNCPITLLIQSSINHYSMKQVLTLLSLMERHKLSLNFNICCSLTLKLISLKRFQDAKLWYDKIYYSKFYVNHFKLLYNVRKLNWPLPLNLNQNLLIEVDNTINVKQLPKSSNHMDEILESNHNDKTNILTRNDNIESDLFLAEDQDEINDDTIFKEITQCLYQLEVIQPKN